MIATKHSCSIRPNSPASVHFVTGGTKGMGEAIVRRLTAGGATVATWPSYIVFTWEKMRNPSGCARVRRRVVRPRKPGSKPFWQFPARPRKFPALANEFPVRDEKIPCAAE